MLFDNIPTAESTLLEFSDYSGEAFSASSKRARNLRKIGAKLILVPSQGGRLHLPKILKDLFSKGIYKLLVEGGGEVIGSFLSSCLVDRMELILAPCLLGAEGVALAQFRGPSKVSEAPRLKQVVWRRFGEDMGCSGRVAWS